MIPRRQLPVHSPIRLGHLVQAALASAASGRQSALALESALATTFGSEDIALTDSGTSALVLALRIACTDQRVVALPAFSCIDLTSAVRYAGVDVVLYDLDPVTLNPDEASLRDALATGVDAVVIAPLYGYPVDMRPITRLAAAHGATVIEDAAQASGARIAGRAVGSHGALSVLSFGRGKGVTGGGGGALLCRDPRFAAAVRVFRDRTQAAPMGTRSLLATAAQWLLGRPSLYALPSFVPGLRLGEMVYHPAHEPRTMSRGVAALVCMALEGAERERQIRAANAARLASIVTQSADVEVVQPVPGATPGYLRLPVIDRGGRCADPRIGVLRSYPLAMQEQAELLPRLRAPRRDLPGALELRRSLFTLPTHSLVGAADLRGIERWSSGTGERHAPVARERMHASM